MIHSLVNEQRKRIESIAPENRLKEIHVLLTDRLIPSDNQSPEHSLTREFRESLANQQPQTIEKGNITLQRHLTREHFTHQQISLQPIGSDSHELVFGRKRTAILEETNSLVVMMEEGITNGKIERLNQLIVMVKAKGKETSAFSTGAQREKAKKSKHHKKSVKIFLTPQYISSARTNDVLSYH